MRRLLAFALLVPLVAGCGWASFFLGGGHATGAAHVRVTTVAPPPTAPANPVSRWIKVERLPKKAIRGALLFATSGCTACHTYAGSGSANLGAPDLTDIGIRHLGIRLQIKHLKDPPSVAPGSPMPPFASLGRKRLHELAVFLEASRGIR